MSGKRGLHHKINVFPSLATDSLFSPFPSPCWPGFIVFPFFRSSIDLVGLDGRFQYFRFVDPPRHCFRVSTLLISFSSDLADDASPLILYSPKGAWTDSPHNDSSALVRPERQTSSLSHVEGDISLTPSSHGTRPLLMVHRQLFALMAIIPPRLFLYFLIPFFRDWSMAFWRKKARLRALQYLYRWPLCIWKFAISRTVIPAITRWSIWPFERPAYCRVHQHRLRFFY